jgi:hypothetical protein
MRERIEGGDHDDERDDRAEQQGQNTDQDRRAVGRDVAGVVARRIAPCVRRFRVSGNLADTRRRCGRRLAMDLTYAVAASASARAAIAGWRRILSR